MGVGLPCTDKTPCRPCYGVPETDCGSAPRYHGKLLSPPSGRVGAFSLLLLAHHPKVVCKLLNLVLFRSTNNDINYLYHLRMCDAQRRALARSILVQLPLLVTRGTSSPL